MSKKTADPKQSSGMNTGDHYVLDERLARRMAEQAARGENRANYALKPPVGKITRVVNKQIKAFLGRLFFRPYLVICLLCAVIGGWVQYNSSNSFTTGIYIIIAPYALMAAGCLLWLVLASYLVMLFGEDTESRIGSVWFFSMSIMPASLLMGFGDTYFMSVLPGQAYVLLFMALLIVGLFIFFQYGDQLFEWGMKYVNPVTHLFNLILILSWAEAFFPYPETHITAVSFSDCYISESTSVTGSKRSGMNCMAEFEYDGVQRQVWVSGSKNNSVVIRHGLFDHYR